VKSIADRHRASIRLENRVPGPGLRATITLPTG
jgi:hypothetical protein